jgi:hypothetical protein
LLLIPVFCLCLFFLITTINSAQAGQATSTQGQKQEALPQQQQGGTPKNGSIPPDLFIQTPQTPQTGIINTPQTPFSPSIFSAHNAWQGQVGSQWIIAYAGSQTNPDLTPGQGGLKLYAVGDFALSPLGTFLAPAGTPALTILKVQGDVLLLQTARGGTLTFNLQTHQFQ